MHSKVDYNSFYYLSLYEPGFLSFNQISVFLSSQNFMSLSHIFLSLNWFPVQELTQDETI